jgi:hypothetical protein
MLRGMARNEEPKGRPGEEWSWASEILDHYPSGVDISQMEERLRLTPTERLERMRGFLLFLEGAKSPGGNRL